MGWRDQSRSADGPSAPAAPIAGSTPGSPSSYATLSQAGAPFKVRAAVGSARERDRLASLQQFYPDAQPTDDGNFVFTDPQTGKLTVYNPKGLDLGDLFSIPREAAETVGGLGGALLGARAGPAGMVAGASMGTAAADRGVDIGRQALGYPQTTTPETLAKDTALDLATGAAGEAGGQLLGSWVPRTLAWLFRRNAAQPVAEAADRLGIEPTAGLLGNRFLQGTETAAANVLPWSSGQRQQGRLVEEAQNRVVTAVPGQPLGREEATRVGGAVLKDAALAGHQRWLDLRANLDRQVYTMMGGQRVPVSSLQQVVNDLRARIGQADNTFGPVLRPVLERLENYLADAAAHGGALPVQTHRNLRTLLGQEMQPTRTTERLPEAQRWYDAAYEAMTRDLGQAAQAAGPRAHQLWQRHDRLVRAYRGKGGGRNLEAPAESLDAIIKTGSDEQAFNALLNGGVNRMANVLNRVRDPAQREIIARATWDRMLITPQGNPNLSYLVGQWNRLDPAKRQLVFGRTASMPELNDLMTVLGGMRQADLARNFSNTAYTLMQASLAEKAGRAAVDNIVSIAAGGGAVMTGHLEEALKTYGAGWLMSYALHRPAVARALSDSLQGRPVSLTTSLRKELTRATVELLGRPELAALVGDDEDK